MKRKEKTSYGSNLYNGLRLSLRTSRIGSMDVCSMNGTSIWYNHIADPENGGWEEKEKGEGKGKGKGGKDGKRKGGILDELNPHVVSMTYLPGGKHDPLIKRPLLDRYKR